MASENVQEKRETLADIMAEYRADADAMDRGGLYKTTTEYVRRMICRISAAVERERARDYELIFRMMWFNAQEFREDWPFGAYARTIRECCARIGVKYSADGKEIAGALDETELGKKLSEEVCDGE